MKLKVIKMNFKINKEIILANKNKINQNFKKKN